MLLRDDTRNSLVSRLGVYGSLPAYIDEISNIEPKEISDLAYKITQGRDRGRLSKNATELKGINGWNTLAIVSSNHSLLDKLASYKGDASAEINRVFEIDIPNGFTANEGRTVANNISENYGIIGKKYAMWLTVNQNKHRDSLEKISSLLSEKSQARADERYWVMTGAVGIYGGLVANRLGISHVDAESLVDWVAENIILMRKYKIREGFDAPAFLGSFLDRYAGGVLVVDSYKPREGFNQIGRRPPISPIIARIELDRNRLWISRDALKHELLKSHISSRKLASCLADKGLVSVSGRLSLGRGTVFHSVAQLVWEIDLTHPALGRSAMAVVQKLGSDIINISGVAPEAWA